MQGWVILVMAHVLFTKIMLFFFQAEDGIREYKLTRVQTCALPIYAASRRCHPCPGAAHARHLPAGAASRRADADAPWGLRAATADAPAAAQQRAGLPRHSTVHSRRATGPDLRQPAFPARTLP